MEFNSLPLEIHLQIFSYLSVREVMRFRRVCKLWNSLINAEFKFKRLQCYQLNMPYTRSYQFQHHEFAFASVRFFLDYTSTDAKFSRVRYLDATLASQRASEVQDTFDFINSFKYLEEIKFKCDVYVRLNAAGETEKQFVISLPYLKKADYSFTANVLLDLPSLLCLSTDSLAAITIGYPEKLRTLATRDLFGSRLDYSKFTSLTDIYTNCDNLRSISASFLESLPSLNEFHVNYDRLPEDYRLPEPSLGKTKPKIFYFGFEVSVREIESDGDQWPDCFDYDRTEESALFVTRYLHRSVNNNPHIYSIDYNTIAGQLDDTVMFGVIPRKFPKIDQLRISGTVADENRLLKFIDKLKVPGFEFERTSLPQRFFEQLAENRPFISTLMINEPTMSILSGDFDFALQFKNLFWLRLSDCPLAMDFVVRALKACKSLTFLSILQSEDFFSQNYFSLMNTLDHPNDFEITIETSRPNFLTPRKLIPKEEILDWMSVLAGQVDGAVPPKELHVLLTRLKCEKEDALFWMRKYIYDQRHSICLSELQMRLLNLRR